jgi:hypothetical protein
MKDNDELEIIEKYIILLLGVVDRPIPSFTHLEKEMFILSKCFPIIQDFFNFEEYHYGAYSVALQETVVEPFYFENAFKIDGNKISLSDSGKKEFKKIVLEGQSDKYASELLSALGLIRELYDKLSVNELLFIIYNTYPESAKFSSVSDNYLKNSKLREKYAKSLLHKGVISQERYNELVIK